MHVTDDNERNGMMALLYVIAICVGWAVVLEVTLIFGLYVMERYKRREAEEMIRDGSVEM